MTDQIDESRAWEYCPGWEPPEAYEAFQCYRDQGPRRTLARTARTLGASYGGVVRWSALYLWSERCASYDTHRERERAAARARAETLADEKWAERRAALLADLNEVADLGAQQLLHDLTTRRTRLRPNELRQIVETLVKWQNLANGDATEKVDLGYDLANMSDEQLQALESIRTLPTKGSDDE